MPSSEDMTPDDIELAPDSMALEPVAPESEDMTPEEMELAPESEDMTPEMERAPESIVPELMSPEEMDLAPDSAMKLEQESMMPQQYLELESSTDFVPDSMPPESQPSTCVRCGTTHACDDVEGCRLARRLASRCARCGLVHSDYDLAARIMDDIDKFDCEIYIPNVEKLQMDGRTILVPEHVLKNLDEKNKKDAKEKQ